jgi:hypothetical protein
MDIMASTTDIEARVNLLFLWKIAITPRKASTAISAGKKSSI